MAKWKVIGWFQSISVESWMDTASLLWDIWTDVEQIALEIIAMFLLFNVTRIKSELLSGSIHIYFLLCACLSSD